MNKPLPFGVVRHGLSAPFLVHVPVAHVVDEGKPAFTLPECVYVVGQSVDLRELAPDDIALDVLHARFTSFRVAGIIVVAPL